MAANFALAPGLATADVINYNSIAGKSLYIEATKSIYEEKDEKYDGSAEKLQGFLYRLQVRADEFGWGNNGILSVSTIPGDVNSPTIYMLEQYAQVTMEQVRLHVAAYIETQSRAAQDSHLLFHSLFKLLDTLTIKKIKNKY